MSGWGPKLGDIYTQEGPSFYPLNSIQGLKIFFQGNTREKEQENLETTEVMSVKEKGEIDRGTFRKGVRNVPGVFGSTLSD
jgi:hypothetical protein